jgi:ABC-2 type transport system ATP-binding protein
VPAISVVALGRTFAAQQFFQPGPAVTALSDVHLTVPASRICGVLGGNGAGKTTVLEILATLIRPTTGTAAINGCDILSHPADVRRQIAYCPSGGTSFFSRLTGRHNLEFFGALHNVPRDRLRARLTESTELFDVEAVLDRRVETYSDGMRQRLALARAHMSGARVWLLDEPTRGLDPRSREHAGRVLRALVRELGITILMTTHDLHEAGDVCDHLVVLHLGRVTLDQQVPVLRLEPGGLPAAYDRATSESKA